MEERKYLDFDGMAERFLIKQIGVDDYEYDQFMKYHQLRKDYEYAAVKEFGINLISREFNDKVTENSSFYESKKEDYLSHKEFLYKNFREAEIVTKELTRLAHLDAMAKIQKMESVNQFINNSEFTVVDVDSSSRFDEVKLSEIGKFKAYMSFEDALRDNYALDYDQVIEDDPNLEVLNDFETFEDFKEAYLVNMSEENQLSFEERNEPVFFASVNYRSRLALPTENFISINDLKDKYTDNDVLVNEINEVLKESYNKGSMDKEFALTEVDGQPFYDIRKGRGFEMEV